MKFTTAILAFATVAYAQSQSGVPSCGQPCLDRAIPKAGCSSGDIKCACSRLDLVAARAFVCLSAKCSPMEAQQTLSALESECLAMERGDDSSS
ncbi:hypothetical protein F4777DRAFT_36260 [Nemania sp. FL0916]|nr:hypothetical protein F4777DRAFT_36260 [Nemania sp. FL0916]